MLNLAVKKPIMNVYPLILASGSVWRKRLAKKHGLICKIHVTDFKERKRGLPPDELVLYNAIGKAHAAGKVFPKAIIIGVDTIGVLGKRILCKPKDRADARRMLLALSGTTHEVKSGLCLLDTRTGKEQSTVVTTQITFKKLHTVELEKYLDSGQWQGKAGSYAIQGRAKGFIEKINGDVTNVVGLPIPTLKKLFKKL